MASHPDSFWNREISEIGYILTQRKRRDVALAFNAQVQNTLLFTSFALIFFFIYSFSLIFFFSWKAPMDKKIVPFKIVTSWPEVIRRDPRELMYDNYDLKLWNVHFNAFPAISNILAYSSSRLHKWRVSRGPGKPRQPEEALALSWGEIGPIFQKFNSFLQRHDVPSFTR